MKRSACLEGCFLLVVGGAVAAIALAIALPKFVTYRTVHPQHKIKTELKNAYKECAYILAKDGYSLPLRDLNLIEEFTAGSGSTVFELYKGDRFDLNAECDKTRLVGKPSDADYGKLAYGLDLGNGDKSCITRSGDEREDWSCE